MKCNIPKALCNRRVIYRRYQIGPDDTNITAHKPTLSAIRIYPVTPVCTGQNELSWMKNSISYCQMPLRALDWLHRLFHFPSVKSFSLSAMKAIRCQILGIHWSTKRATREGLFLFQILLTMWGRASESFGNYRFKQEIAALLRINGRQAAEYTCKTFSSKAVLHLQLAPFPAPSAAAENCSWNWM